MPIYNIRGIDVDFPLQAYDCQIVYMEKVIRSLQEGKNALLESPTGTGKTLSLLCATLAWRKSFGEFSTNPSEEKGWGSSQPSSSQSVSSTPSDSQRSGLPVIIYTSRTHSQLKQVIRELKTSNYRPKMAILGSREQMCIHDDVRLLRGKAQNHACQYMCKKRKCRHHPPVSEFVKRHNPLGNEPFDIEDLVNIGRTKGPCPYYVSRELHKSADILFAPYNYLIDPGNRRSLTGIPWSKAVLIFDEAHNLESICADAASFDLPSTYIASCISEANQCIDLCGKKLVTEKSADKQFDPDNYAILKALLTKLEKKVGEVVIQSKEQGFTRPGSYIYEFLSDLNITFETANMLMDTIENAAQLLEEGNNAASGAETKPKGTVCRLETIRDVLNIIFRDGGKSHSLFYRFHVQESQSNYSESFKGTTSRTLSWWCFNPGLAMQEFEKLGVRSIILTSGTLSPLDSFALELNLDFPIRLENPHVIDPDQIWVGVVPTGPSGYPLNSSFRTRDSLEYKQELGNTIVNFARIVPDGLLVFFPSYYMMNQCIECWKSMSHACSTQASTIWERICKHKHPVIEPKQSALFSHAIEDFETKLRDQSTSGAIFLAVCRGKVSEGLDFADQAGRAVVITGMPFSMLTDPKVRLKREYLDQQAFKPKTNLKGLTGEEWYVQQAARAVNQAVGRVIRHRNDYGAIIFCDERFVQQGRQEQMSYWLRPHVKCYSKFGDVIFTMARFFREKKNSSLLKPKKETFSVHEQCSDKDRAPEITVPSSQSPTSLVSSAAQSCSGKPRLLIQASTSRTKIDNFTPLGSILPANRATLPEKFHKLPQQFKYFKRDLDSHCEEVVDLTGEEPVNSLFALKKPKVLETGNAHLEGENRRVLPFSLCGQKSEKKEVIVGNTSSSTCGGEVESRGSAFLAQVREKLSKAEYNEFVGFMKALKSKTLSITPVLESIAKLFSFPGRFSLLKMFKDFVPIKYHEKYEELLRIHGSQD
ncbi:regulator of telomere elongation helicase 1 [Carex littledalei]|uniref:Regulator of telomere elongation helicase 1 homolog n=1 Tax=Carex littledalei TaxID=544730 RepID=A0A833QJ34_9POAL|nr:regulator of telomere elongation helicase 1 [Carex littledalei]